MCLFFVKFWSTWAEHRHCFFSIGHIAIGSRTFLAVQLHCYRFSFSEFLHVQACNGYTTLSSTQGHISSPHYPNYNPQASYCYWLIHVELGRIITLEFQTFDVGQGTECSALESRKTYVEVRDGTNNATVGTFCGSETPKVVRSHSNRMLVAYVANGYRSTKFTARYHTTKGETHDTYTSGLIL